MSQCIDHKTTFLDTHRHFRLAIEVSNRITIVCGGLELMFAFAAHVFEMFDVRKKSSNFTYDKTTSEM